MTYVKRYIDVHEFSSAVKSFLMENEANNNLALGVLEQALTTDHDPSHLFVSVEEDDEIQLVLLQTAMNLIVAGEKTYLPIALDFIETEGIKIEQAIGPKDLLNDLAILWTKKTGSSYEVLMKQRIYKLDKLAPINLVNGRLRKATSADIQFLVKWLEGFTQEAIPGISHLSVEKVVTAYIDSESLYIWEDEVAVSMVRKARPSANGIVINSVFTPIEYRKRGYASSCVHTFAKMLLEEYEFCSLYADRSNPTSNNVYQKIGFQHIADSTFIKFIY